MTNHEMRALTVPRYGGPEVLKVALVPRPVPGAGEVLVQVAWGTVNAADWRLMRADPWMVRLAFGIRRPRFTTLGIAMAGTVVESSVASFAPGDRVMADLSASGCGAFAEYVCAKAAVLVPVPEALELDCAATLPLAATTALQALRDQAQIGPGARVLVTGASGAVGSAAVQLAREFGAQVWAVTSTNQVEFVAALGAHCVIDRLRAVAEHGDVTAHPDLPRGAFDGIIDCGGYRSIFDYEPLLAPQGTYVFAGGSMVRLAQTAVSGALRSRRDGKRWKAFAATANVEDLKEIASRAAAGGINSPIGARIPLADAAEAIRLAETHAVPGRVLIWMIE